jgi:hypothetical protein
MRRRDFVTGLGIAAALPAMSRAQQATPTIGFLSTRSPDEAASTPMRFAAGLRRRAMSRATASPLNTAGLTAIMVSCRHSRPTC